jgi:hypothetical protein
MGSPFTATVCEVLADTLSHKTKFGTRVLDWPNDPIDDGLPLRAAGALNWLARQGLTPELSAQYPPQAPQPIADLSASILKAISCHDDKLTAFLDSAPQTNEIGRSAIILTGALEITRQTNLPLATYEIGASAGLNLIFDQYRYTLGGTTWGLPDASIHLAPEWQGSELPTANLQLASRSACDLNPLDIENATDRERMLAYIWPDQTHRLIRTEKAFALAASQPWRVEKADAADWVEQHFQTAEPGTVKTLVHTVVWQYLPFETRTRIEQQMTLTGQQATPDAPIAWLRLEPDGNSPGGAIILTLWPGGKPRTIGRADFHGRWINLFETPTNQIP